MGLGDPMDLQPIQTLARATQDGSMPFPDIGGQLIA